MSCSDLSYDNRETCTTLTTSSCVPYTGAINEDVTTELQTIAPCGRPNINDIIKSLQSIIDKLKATIGNNKTLTTQCLTFTPSTVTQKELNQLFINELCTLKSSIENLQPTVDPETFMVAINLLCLETDGCDPQNEYSLQVILEKLITNYCNLLTRIQNIETVLNL